MHLVLPAPEDDFDNHHLLTEIHGRNPPCKEVADLVGQIFFQAHMQQRLGGGEPEAVSLLPVASRTSKVAESALCDVPATSIVGLSVPDGLAVSDKNSPIPATFNFFRAIS